MEDQLSYFIKALGFIYAFKLIFSLTVDIKHGFFAYMLPTLCRIFCKEVDFPERFGNWALVTGCTQGIGRAYVTALAKKGMNIILASRNFGTLTELAKEVEEKFHIKTLVIVIDFAENDVSMVMKKIKEQNIEVGMLVNNVGILGPHFMPFLELEEKMVRDMISVNITTATLLCHSILPGMLERNRGAIINICSSSSFYTMPFMTEYSATKHYIAAFTAGLQIENENTNVIIQELDPGQVNTNMTKELIPISSIEAPHPEQLVISSLKTLGFTKQTGGWWFHSLHAFLVSWMFPKWFLQWFLKGFGSRQYKHAVLKKKEN